MQLFICGLDVVARKIADYNPGAVLFTDEDVNNTDAWPYIPDLIVSVGYLHILKQPDLTAVEDCGLHEWQGAAGPLKTAAAHAKLGFAQIDLGKAKDKATLFAEVDRALALPEHFGHNWDALADVLEDRDWLGKSGRVVVLAHATAYRKDHPNDYGTLEEILGEAAEFWQERHVPFWVFVA